MQGRKRSKQDYGTATVDTIQDTKTPVSITFEGRSVPILQPNQSALDNDGEATDADSDHMGRNDSDSDSDFEKLLARASNRPIKTYSRGRKR